MSQLDLVGLLQGRVSIAGDALEDKTERIDGVTLGVVTDTTDPKHLGRVKVRLPWLSQCVVSAWARLALPWAGQRRGSYLLPEVGDDVLVSFQHGDVRFPFVVGFMWSEKAPPPAPEPGRDQRELRSKSGHLLVFDDTTKREKLTIHSQGGHDITLDDAKSEITILAKGGNATIRVNGQTGAIAIEAKTGDLDVSAPKGMLTLSGANVQVLAKSELKLDGRTAVRINC